MTLGHVPARERIVLPRRGAPLGHVITANTAFPTGTTATLYLYDKDDTVLGFWPLTVSGATITIDVDGEDLDVIPNHCGFTIFVEYTASPGKTWPLYEGFALRMV